MESREMGAWNWPLDENNIVEINGDDEITGKVNSDDDNIAKVNNQRDNFAKEICEANHFEDERRNIFVSKICNDENIEAVNTCKENTEEVNQRIILKTAEQTCDHDGRKINQHNFKSRLNKDPRYPNDNG